MCAMSSHPTTKSKQIKRAHKALEKALEQHAELATASGVSLKKAQRANAKLAAAATAYADAVTAKTGLERPFSTGSVGLDGDTIASLQSERDDIERAVTGTIPAVVDEQPEPETAAEPDEQAESAEPEQADEHEHHHDHEHGEHEHHDHEHHDHGHGEHEHGEHEHEHG